MNMLFIIIVNSMSAGVYMAVYVFCPSLSLSLSLPSPSYHRALGSFETGDLAMAHDHIESLSGGLHMSRDPEVFPLWDPGQLLNTSHLLLLKAATSQAVDDGSGSDDVSVTSEGEYGPR